MGKGGDDPASRDQNKTFPGFRQNRRPELRVKRDDVRGMNLARRHG